MAKAIRTAATIVGAVATVVSFIPGPWQAPALLVSKVAAVVAVAASAEIALTTKNPGQTLSGSQDKFTASKDQGLPIAFGRSGIAGYLVHRQTWDYSGSTNNAYQTFFGVYSIGPMSEFQAFQADGATVTFSGEAATGGYAGYMWLRTQAGEAPEPSALPATSFNPYPSGWSATSKMSGYAAFTWTVKFDDKGKTYPGAVIPAPLAVGRWVHCYDPRFDSTYPGGVGAQRSNDPTSWGWTQNPWIAALQWALGWWQNGKRVAGIGFALAAIDVPAFVNAANIADANSFTCGGVVYSTDGKWDVLKKLAAAGSGQPLQLGGILSCECDAPRVSLATITTDQIIGDCTVTAAPTMSSKINGVIPTYRSEAHQWSMVPAALVQVSAYVTADGRPKTQAVTWDLVQDAAQVAKLAAYTVCNAREFGPIVVPLKLRWAGYKPGDCLTIASDELGMSSQMVVVSKRHLDPASGAVTLTMRSETYSKHAFCLGQTGSPPPAPSLQSIDRSLLIGAGDGSGVGTWSPILTGWSRSGSNFFKAATVGWDDGNSIRSSERFTSPEAGFTITNASHYYRIGFINPATGDFWALYPLGTGFGGDNTYYFCTGNVSDLPHVLIGSLGAPTVTTGDSVVVEQVGSQILAWVNGVPISAPVATGLDPSVPLALYASAYNGSAEIDSLTFGKAGTNGKDAPLLTLQPDADAFTYNGDGAPSPSAQVITLAVKFQNVLGPPTTTATAYDASGTGLGSVTLGGTEPNRTITLSTLIASYPTWAKIIAASEIGSISDIQTIVRLTNGSDAVTPYLSNDSASVAAASDGTVASFTGTGGTMKLFKGASALTSSVTFSVLSSDPALTISINSSTGAYTISGLSADQAVATLRAHYNGLDYDRVYSIAKSKAGVSAPSLGLTSTAQVMTFDGTGAASPSSQSISFAAVLQNLAGTATWSAQAFNASGTSLGTTGLLSTSGNTATMSQSQFATYAGTAYVKVTASLSGLSDTETVVKLQAGSDAVVGYLTNEAMNVQADSSGTVTGGFSGAGGTFKVFRGTTDITTGASVAYSVVSSSGVTISINSSTGVYTVSAMSADQGSATLQAQVTINGVLITVQKNYAIAKSKAGTNGNNGSSGTSVGTTLLYQRSASTPSLPTNNPVLTLATGALSPAPNNGWSTTVPTTNGQPLYVTTCNWTTTGTTVTLSSWTAAVIQAQDGAAGTGGSIPSTGINQTNLGGTTTTVTPNGTYFASATPLTVSWDGQIYYNSGGLSTQTATTYLEYTSDPTLTSGWTTITSRSDSFSSGIAPVDNSLSATFTPSSGAKLYFRVRLVMTGSLNVNTKGFLTVGGA